ncbi:MAG: CRISPR-associated endonuclease Cas3'' [Limnochordaceae bacterium]|nr:CRISPR-associated endonuclease Cas3'' [Limnochordaceae bacterium]
MVNTVERAQRLHAELRRLLSPRKQAPELGLIHSRFRPQERMRLQQWLLSDVAAETPGRIVVATQVIEAGVDVSAATLFTEVAPWSSIVQRLGRCNRYGEVQEGARVFWIDVGEKETAPYESEAIDEARRLLASLEGADVSPASLERVASSAPTHERPIMAHVVRRRDLLGLFDTTPDLSGQHLDVSRFIREGADLDVLVYWRSWGEGDPPTALRPPSKQELCPVPVQEVRRFVEDPRRAAWLWDPLARAGAGGWVRVRPNELRPGYVVLLRASDGGYSSETGWARDVRSAVPVADNQASSQADRPQDSHDDDHYTTAPERWVTLETHTLDVMTELERSLARLVDLDLGMDAVQALRQAAAHHDVGKSHPEFQAPMMEALPDGEQALRRRCLWAKAPRLGNRSRRPFRHELASALAFLQAVANDSAEDEQADLVAFLIAGHHGKVRLAIRSLPAEKPPDREGVRFAQGIWDGDVLPRVTIDGLVQLPALALSLSLMELGLSEAGSAAFRSWSDRMLALRDSPRWGPFRLGFLEALLRAADVRASMREKASSQEGKEGGEEGCHASS